MNRRNFLIHGSTAVAGLLLANSPLRLYAAQHEQDHSHGHTLPALRYPHGACLLYTSPSPRDRTRSRMPSSA